MSTRAVQLHRLIVILLLAVSAAGCARVFGSYDIAPNGLARSEDRLRRMLVSGQADDAFARVTTGETAPADDVLRVLYEGVIAYHAGEYERSARLLDVAGELADDRITKSLSRSALSLISNDLVLPYEPGPTERVMIPWYGALARLRLGDVDGAAVEARRLSFLLQYFDGRDQLDNELNATLRYFAASVFALAGEHADADVAYRNAVALGSTLPPPLVSSADSGTVVVVLERGFVAHRAEQSLMVMLLPEEIDALSGGGDHRFTSASDVAARVLSHAAHAMTYAPGDRIGALFVPAPEHTPRKRLRKKTVCTERDVAPADSTKPAEKVKECREVEEEVDDLPYLLKVAWPVYRADYRPRGTPRLLCEHDTISFAGDADLSRAVVRDFERERTLLIARTIARGAAKAAISRGAERKLEEKSDVAGKIAGLLGNVGNVLLERADTRSWHLLPAGITLAHVRLPAGEHDIEIDLPDTDSHHAATVTVRAGAITILPVRAW
jgi:hypothetical protein